MNHVSTLWFHFGTVRYGFPVSWFFNSLRARYVSGAEGRAAIELLGLRSRSGCDSK